MALSIARPEVFGVTESSLTLAFAVEDASGPVDAEARVVLDGEPRIASAGIAGTRLVRIEGLAPATRYRIGIEVAGADPALHDPYFPESVCTLPRPDAALVGSFATLNDLHFGEPRFGGVLSEDFEFGDEAPDSPLVRESDTEVPYWRFMNEDAIDEVNALGVDTTIIKGDIADRGRPEQFEAAARAFARFEMPHHAFLGNHDYYGLNDGLEVDGYALLGQPRAPRTLDLGGWRLVLLETVEPGEHHGVFPDERLRWLEAALEETRECATPTLLLMHHQPVPPEHRDHYPNTIGIESDHSLALFDAIGRHPQVRGVLIGHTHRNRVRRHPASGTVPFVEVNCTKDYPGGFAHYRLFEDGSFRQEVRRTSSQRALEHSTRCQGMFRGGYRLFALGGLEARSFVAGDAGDGS
ncbi:MAG: metallophosphoesterase [Myxococcales bacterium]|nr:metallophosphoesterase [Myxococcales bacterium]